MIENNVIKNNKRDCYCRELKGIIDYSFVTLKTENKYDKGTINESLNAMLRNLKEVQREINGQIKLVNEALNKINTLF